MPVGLSFLKKFSVVVICAFSLLICLPGACLLHRASPASAGKCPGGAGRNLALRARAQTGVRCDRGSGPSRAVLLRLRGPGHLQAERLCDGAVSGTPGRLTRLRGTEAASHTHRRQDPRHQKIAAAPPRCLPWSGPEPPGSLRTAWRQCSLHGHCFSLKEQWEEFS